MFELISRVKWNRVLSCSTIKKTREREGTDLGITQRTMRQIEPLEALQVGERRDALEFGVMGEGQAFELRQARKVLGYRRELVEAGGRGGSHSTGDDAFEVTIDRSFMFRFDEVMRLHKEMKP